MKKIKQNKFQFKSALNGILCGALAGALGGLGAAIVLGGGALLALPIVAVAVIGGGLICMESANPGLFPPYSDSNEARNEWGKEVDAFETGRPTMYASAAIAGIAAGYLVFSGVKDKAAAEFNNKSLHGAVEQTVRDNLNPAQKILAETKDNTFSFMAKFKPTQSMA